MKYYLSEGSVPPQNKYLVDHIIISELGKGRHDVESIELDSHSRMIDIGSQGYIIQATGQCAEFKSFSDKLSVLENAPIIDAVITYYCLSLITTYPVVANNLLHVPRMSNNLIVPFITRKSGLILNEITKIHTELPIKENLSI